MVKVHKRKARTNIYFYGRSLRNDNRKNGLSFTRSQPSEFKSDFVVVSKGQEYYSWSLWGDKQLRVSDKYPTRQQLTKSEFLKSVYDIEDDLNRLIPEEGINNNIKAIVSNIEILADEQERKRNNMPDHLRSLKWGSLLESRFESLHDWVASLNAILGGFDDRSVEQMKVALDNIKECKYEGR